jgi:phospholipase C
MKPSGRLAARCSPVLAALAVGCAGGPSSIAPGAPQSAAALASATTTPIKHVVLLIQENRSFDNFFATFPGADGATHGRLHDGTVVPLSQHDLAESTDVPHSYASYRTDYDGGKMDGFDLTSAAINQPPLTSYQYVDPTQIAVYWTLAKRYVLADRMFTTQGSNSFTAHQDLIAGGTQIDPDHSIVDSPDAYPWGCDAPPGTKTSLVARDGTPLWNKGPFPCFTYETIAVLLSRKHLSWRYYATARDNVWNAFEAIRPVRFGPQWSTNISAPQTRIFRDISSGKLASVSWVIPTADFSDHPNAPKDLGPDWIGNVVNAIGESPYWNSTAIFIVWDDWGGMYDHVTPPQLAFGGLGFRVPAIIVSPYARSGYVAHEQYEFGSLLRFIEDNWRLGTLGTTDARANGMAGAFDFAQKPRRFVPVRVAHSRDFFVSLPPSKRPLDSE